MTGKDQHETRDELRRGGTMSHPDEPLPEGEEAPPPGTRVMAVVRWALVLLMAVAAVASVGWYLGWFRGTAADASSAGTVQRNAMVPADASHKPCAGPTNWTASRRSASAPAQSIRARRGPNRRTGTAASDAVRNTPMASVPMSMDVTPGRVP